MNILSFSFLSNFDTLEVLSALKISVLTKPKEVDRRLTEESKFQVEIITALLLENIYLPF